MTKDCVIVVDLFCAT